MSLSKADAQAVQTQLKAQINTFMRKVKLQSSKLTDIVSAATILQGSTDDTISAMQSEDDINNAIDKFEQMQKVFQSLTKELSSIAKAVEKVSDDIETVINSDE